jgi:hypothetical protein
MGLMKMKAKIDWEKLWRDVHARKIAEYFPWMFPNEIETLKKMETCENLWFRYADWVCREIDTSGRREYPPGILIDAEDCKNLF